MRLAFFVNDIMAEQAGYTTTRLGLTAVNREHQVWLVSASDFLYTDDDKVYATARSVRRKRYTNEKAYLSELQSPDAVKERILVDDLDVLMLRSDPARETGTRSWAQTTGITFGRVATHRGVIVLNDPEGLIKAVNKMYFQLFPEEVRPKTLISQNRNDIRDFIKDVGGNAVLKPLQGSGGSGVFLAQIEDRSNVNQMIDALIRDGYVIVQEYLAAADQGDMRLFLMNGRPLRYRGHYAAFRRVRSGEDLRSNIHAGGRLARADVDEKALKLAEVVRPKLVQDGMFLVGLDIVDDKLMEINVFSPGGLGSAQRFEKVDFTHAVLDALERKVAYMMDYHRNFANAEMAML